MGRGNGRRRRIGGRDSSNTDGTTGEGGERSNNGEWTSLSTDNELFQKYYQSMPQLVAPEEWDEFKKALETPLPFTYRITGSKGEAHELRDVMKERYFTAIMDPTAMPKPIPWYPEELGWSFNLTRREVKKSPGFKAFHQFLVNETELGNISRQEAVSMLPPMFLDVQAGHKVLDMCAAPGSKTAQLIEAVHGDSLTESGDEMPTGMVIANDSDLKRAFILIHQTQRLLSPCTAVTNLDATSFPTVFLPPTTPGSLEANILQFDRVLCDVPCSSDGTLRKNPMLWRKWAPLLGLNLHFLQYRILHRGVELLKIGGKIIYSTCSFNPVENEAVVATMLKEANGALELVDVSNLLPLLRRRPGVSDWNVMTKKGNVFNKYEDIQDAVEKDTVRASMFAPEPSVAAGMHLERCVRIFPHLQDSGGFFVAVFEKKSQYGKLDRIMAKSKARAAAAAEAKKASGDASADASGPAMEADLQKDLEDAAQIDDLSGELDDAKNAAALVNAIDGANESAVEAQSKPAGGRQKTNPDKYNKPINNDPFTFVPEDFEDFQKLYKAYGFSDKFPRGNLLVRSENVKANNVFLISKSLKEVLLSKDCLRLRIIQIGTRFLNRNENTISFYRLMQDALPFNYINGMRVEIPSKDFITMLKNHQPFTDSLTKETRETIEQLCKTHGHGFPMLFDFDARRPDPTVPADAKYYIKHPIVVCGYIGKKTSQVLVDKKQRESLLSRFSENLESFTIAEYNPTKRSKIVETSDSMDVAMAADTSADAAAIASSSADAGATDNVEADADDASSEDEEE